MRSHMENRMIFAPLMLVGLICNLTYCAVKITQDLRNGRAVGIVGLIGAIGGPVLSVIAIATVMLTSNGELT